MLKTYKFDQLDGHPVIAPFDQQVKEPRSKWEEILRSPPSQLTDDINNSSRDTWILVLVLQSLLDFGPRRPQRLWVHECKSVQGDDCLLANHGHRVRQTWDQIGKD